MGNPKVAAPAILLASAALVLAACGSNGNDSTVAKRPKVPAATADRLARLSEQIASDLDAGQTCSAAYVADELSSAVREADVPAAMRPAIDQVTRRLVDEVNCPPPPPPPREKNKPEHGKHGKGNDQGNGGGPKPPGHGGKLPPGQAKLKGEGD